MKHPSFLKNLSFFFLIIILVSCSKDEPANPKVSKLKLQPGFKAEHIFSPSEIDMGSWVSMAFDNKGRLITSDQYGALYRLEIPAIGSDSLTPKIERLSIKSPDSDSVLLMGHAQGLLYAFNSLYVMVNNRVSEEFPVESGLYRLQDTNNDVQYDRITQLKPLKGDGEHGPHSIILSPDGKSLYVVSGNHTDAPEMDAYRLPSNWQHDNLFPHLTDPRGHAERERSPEDGLQRQTRRGKIGN